jgi:hypothetical protein
VWIFASLSSANKISGALSGFTLSEDKVVEIDADAIASDVVIS